MTGGGIQAVSSAQHGVHGATLVTSLTQRGSRNPEEYSDADSQSVMRHRRARSARRAVSLVMICCLSNFTGFEWWA